MASLFSRIIRGELPARFVYEDDRAVVFLSIQPLRAGHVLVVPRDEIDDWLDLPEDLAQHLFAVARRLGKALRVAFGSKKVGMMVVGLEVPHVHIHLVPIDAVQDVSFANQNLNPDPAELDDAAEKVRSALVEQAAHLAV